MSDIKGFVSMPSLENNASGIVAPFGELSVHSRTFTRDHQVLSNPDTTPSTSIVVFKSTNNAGDTQVVPTLVGARLMLIAEWVYDQHISGQVPSNANKQAFINSLEAEFPDVERATLGQILNGASPTRKMPDFIKFVIPQGTEEHRCTLWFSDAKFRTQYKDYTILIVPPINTIDLLNNNNTPVVSTMLSERTTPQFVARMNQVSNGIPYTIMQTYDLTWHQPDGGAGRLPTTWSAIIYGDAGTDLDAIKNAVREYIAQHTDNTNWDDIYPDLYAENEYAIVPLWENIAIPETGLDIGLYSPVTNVGKLINVMLARSPSGYGQTSTLTTHLATSLEIFGTPYRSMQLLAIGNPNNPNEQYAFSQQYPDYLNVPTTSSDYSRMSEKTRLFYQALMDCLEQARRYTEGDIPPNGLTKTIRGNRIYLTFVADGYQWHVLTRVSYRVQEDDV